METGAGPEARDLWNRTPLHWVVGVNAYPAVLQAPLEAGANVEARDDDGNTPLYTVLLSVMDVRTRIGMRAHFTALIQMLLGAGADVQARHERWGRRETAVEVATETLQEGLPRTIFDAVLQAAAEQDGPVPIEEVGETIAGMEFVWIPSGEFRMGSTSSEAEDSERPVTRVRISRGFWLGQYEVTQDQWQGVMGTNPSQNTRCGGCAVEQVS